MLNRGNASLQSKIRLCRSIQFRRHDAAAPRDIRALRLVNTTHGVGLCIKGPLHVRPRQETPLGIPSSDPSVSVIETEEQAFDRRSALFKGNIVPATALFHLIFEDVAVQDAAVDQWHGHFFVVLVAVAVDEMPAAARDVFVDTRHWRLPVLLAMDGTVDALAALEPVDGAEDGPKTEKEVWRHDRSSLNKSSRVENRGGMRSIR